MAVSTRKYREFLRAIESAEVGNIWDLAGDRGYEIACLLGYTFDQTHKTMQDVNATEIIEPKYDRVYLANVAELLGESANINLLYKTADSPIGVSSTDPITASAAVISFVTNDTADTGTATASDETTLTQNGKTWTTDEHQNQMVVITGGTGAGQRRRIASNTADALTVSVAWTVNPSTDSTYKILDDASRFLYGYIDFGESAEFMQIVLPFEAPNGDRAFAVSEAEENV